MTERKLKKLKSIHTDMALRNSVRWRDKIISANGFGIGAVSNVETASRFGLGKFRSSATASKFRPSLIAPNAMIAEVARV